MTRCLAITGKARRFRQEVLIVPLFERPHPLVVLNDQRLEREVADTCSQRGFTGKQHEVLWHYRPSKPYALLSVGLGRREGFSSANWFLALSTAMRELAKSQHQSAAVAVGRQLLEATSPEKIAQQGAQAVLYGAYQFSRYRKSPRRYGIRTVRFSLDAEDDAKAFRRGLQRGLVVGEAVNVARDPGNAPANDMTPTHLAEAALALRGLGGVMVRIIDKKRFREEGLGALWGVSKGSGEDAKLIIIEYRGGEKTAPVVGFVGKGVTFDSGGISIKPSEKMDEMKFDMAGGGAVIGLIRAAAKLALPRNIVGVIPATENLPGGESYKPGDVLRALDGTTIEVLNTDAEGRVILADALCYIRRYKPQVVVDLATLTGACIAALGSAASGLFTADERLAEEFLAAGGETGERLWRLPLFEEYREQIKSDVADVQNISKRKNEAGASIGAAFLQHFAKPYRWAHIDIAGTAWTNEERPYAAKGATGVGIRLALAYLEKSPATG